MMLLKDKWLYISTPKCATHSMYQVCRKLGAVRAKAHGGIHLTPGSERFAPLHFTICRNPYDRAVSMWAFDMHRPERREKGAAWAWEKLEKAEATHSFADYIRNIILDPRDAHNKPKPTYFSVKQWVGRFLHDKVLHLESLPQELSELLGESFDRLPRLNNTHHKPWKDVFNDETLALIRPWAEPDCKAFGYEVL